MQVRSWSIIGAIATIAVIGSVGLWWQRSRSISAAEELVSEAAGQPSETGAANVPAFVELTPEKRKIAGVSLGIASRTTLRPEHLVPGRLQYDDRRHVEIRAAAEGIITEVRVNPGDAVHAGDVLVEINTPEVGNARADVLQRNAELKLAIENRAWQRSTCSGLKKLSEAIRSKLPVNEIRTQFQDIVLGKSREQLLSAYSQLLLADSLAQAAERNAKEGVVPGRIVEERLNERNNAESALLAALEEKTFEATQNCRLAEATAEDAERRLRISLQTVKTLLGRMPAGSFGSAASETLDFEEDLNAEALSLVELRAPISGTVERRVFSRSERVRPGDSLMTVADTSTLWVSADLREREWNALTLKPGDQIAVITSIAGMESLKATVHFVGREVDPLSNAVPLVATIDNRDGQLRPGMFVRVAVPGGAPRETLTVPESSILEHDRKAFVFSPEGESGFRQVAIQPGLRAHGLVEILSGLTSGEQVVVSGGFYLKSELLLQGQAE